MDNSPITTADLQAVLERHFAKTVSTRLNAMEHRLLDDAHRSHSEIASLFESTVARQDIRLRRLEVEQQNMDASLSGRMAIVERRLFEIEKKLLIRPPG